MSETSNENLEQVPSEELAEAALDHVAGGAVSEVVASSNWYPPFQVPEKDPTA